MIVQLVDDRYEVREVIASGGMATVYRAIDQRLDRPVAMKRPHPGPPGNDLDARIEREARAAAGLNHPNVVTVYDYGRDETGPFLVMELVDGPTLQEKAGDISTVEAFGIGAQLADGLAAIHAAGVVHRDVKPSNVIMSQTGPMLTDFGIAHVDGSEEKLTNPGTVVATPSYAAPEVLSGEPPTAASDVYSLALVVRQLAADAGGDVDPGVASVLKSSLSDSPHERPDAAGLAAVLREGVPTAAMAALAGGSVEVDEPTLILGADQTPTLTRRTAPATAESRSRWLLGVLLGALLVAIVWTGLAIADRDTDQQAMPVTGSTLLATTSTLITITTSPPATATTMTSAAEPEDLAISEALASLGVILLDPFSSRYKPSGIDKVIEKIEHVIEVAEGGDTKHAEKDLNALAKDFDRKLDSEQRDDALALLASIASSVGVEIDDDFDGDEDD